MSGATINGISREKAARAALLIGSLRTTAEQLDDAIRKDMDILGATTRANLKNAAKVLRRAADALHVSVQVQVDAGVARKTEGAP